MLLNYSLIQVSLAPNNSRFGWHFWRARVPVWMSRSSGQPRCWS